MLLDGMVGYRHGSFCIDEIFCIEPRAHERPVRVVRFLLRCVDRLPVSLTSSARPIHDKAGA